MATYLITDKELIKGSPVTGNIDYDKYRPVIEDVQDLVIEPILGTKLFDKIITDFGADSLAGVYATIHADYLKKIIINSVAAEYVLINNVNVTNAGNFSMLPSDTQPADLKEVRNLASSLKAKADVYIERLQRYLQDKQADITEYPGPQDNNYDVDSDKRVTTYGGFYLPYEYRASTLEQEIWKDIIHDEGKT